MSEVIQLDEFRKKTLPAISTNKTATSENFSLDQDLVYSTIHKFICELNTKNFDVVDPDFLLDMERIADLLIASIDRLERKENPNIKILDALR